MPVYSHPDASTLIPPLTAHLPHSLPLLLRLKHPFRTPSSLFLSTFPPNSNTNPPTPTIFTAAYVDASRPRKESAAWVFCSLEPVPLSSISTEDKDAIKQQVFEIIKFVKGHPSWGYGEARELLLASLHPLVIDALRRIESVEAKESEICNKYIFTHLPPMPSLLEGFRFGQLTTEAELQRVIDTSYIKRTMTLLSQLKNCAIFYGDKPVAWTFVSLDGSMVTLYVEEEYRGRGLGRAVGSAIMRVMEGEGEYIGHVDIIKGNNASVAVVKGLEGQMGWDVKWVWVI
jgi:GNAT superfamily N-acetyltransferase